MIKLIKINKIKNGFTLIELLIVMIIAGILAAIAAPGYFNMVDRFRLRSAIESIRSDLAWMKSMAISDRKTFIFTMTGVGSNNWAYYIGYNAPNGVINIKTVTSPTISSDNVTLQQSETIRMFPLSSIPNISEMNGTGIKLTSKLNKNIVITTTLLGQVEVCSPDATMLIYYKAC